MNIFHAQPLIVVATYGSEMKNGWMIAVCGKLHAFFDLNTAERVHFLSLCAFIQLHFHNDRKTT